MYSKTQKNTQELTLHKQTAIVKKKIQNTHVLNLQTNSQVMSTY